MTLTITPKTQSLINGTANDASIVNQMFIDTYGNEATIAAYINSNMPTLAGNNSFTGTATFTNIVNLSSTVSVTGLLELSLVSDPATYPAGSFWYSATNNAFEGSIQTTTITGATNANPIVVTTTRAHGLQTGGSAYITGVVGNTAANGTFTVTVTGPTTFSLGGSTGNGAYSSGGTVSLVKQILTTGYIPASDKGALFGLTLANNAGTPTTDIDIAAGQCIDDTNADLMVLSSGITKRFSATWVVGTGNGGSDTGTIPTSGTLHVYVIKRPDTGVVDVFCSTSLTPTLPTSYTLKRRIGSLTSDASAHMQQFKQYGDRFEYQTPAALDVDVTNQSTSAVTRTLNVPTGLQFVAIIRAFIKCTQADLAVYFRNLDNTDTAPSDSASPLSQLIQAVGTNGAGGEFQIMTSTLGQISTRGTIPSGTAATIVKIATVGWIDNRGRY